MDEYLASTEYIDADNPMVRAKAGELIAHVGGKRGQAIALFGYVRDRFPYKIKIQPRAGRF
ncbi:MAG: hypothetical protein FJ149_04565 [Euryarchaeota archaeon]|nr:hypothetical protein [Euryarchaeota archaeon]